jgi:hypothetical protein
LLVKVLLVVIDAASPRVVCPAIQTGQLPNLKRVADAGSMHQQSVTIFPSLTPAATASIATGAYPAEHGIAGASWYDQARDEIAYYGDDFWTIAEKGFGTFLRDFLVRLNGDRLKAPTLFELIERTGRPAACVNYLVYRGCVTHKVRVPGLLALLPGVPFTETVDGPSVLCLGDFVTRDTQRRRKVDNRSGPLHRFGMDDASSAAMLGDLAADGALGDFTLAYFADNDYRSHEVGPQAALPVVERVDQALGHVFDASGGFERFTRETCVIVTSDHSQCEVLGDPDRAVVRLDNLLSDFRQADIGREWREGDEIMICPNMRAAQIYLQRPGGATVERVTRASLADPRVDLVLWRLGLRAGEADAYAVESQRGRLEFWRSSVQADGRSIAGTAADAFGTVWSWRGDRAALQLESDGRLVESTEYPNAFERIAGALDAPNSGHIWLSAQPGCEFEIAGGKAHVGGASHGALHALDSLSPVVVGGAGAPGLPRAMRSLDIAPLCMELLGLTMRYRVGDPRGAAQPVSVRS